MKKIIANFCLLFAGSLFGQQDISLQNILPPSPDASAFIKSGMYPVGTYTGKPDITIPIYEIKTNTLSVPITINYDATGIRVNDISSCIGMNWSLNAGGMISQLIVGEADKMSTSIYDVPPRASDIVNNSTYFNYFQAFIDRDQYPGYADGDPDKFFYVLPNGKSGSFVLDRNRNVMQIPKTSNKISIIGALNSFNITDEIGTNYIFSIRETMESYIYNRAGQFPQASSNDGNSSYKNQSTSYYLSEIVSSSGEQIHFSYENYLSAPRDDFYSETWGNKYPGSQGAEQFPIRYYHGYRWTGVQRVISTPQLKEITFSNGKVEFSRATRQDDYGSRLDEITVYKKTDATYTKLKSFKFIQGYYYSSDNYGQYSGFPNQAYDRYRLRLDAIQLRDTNGDNIPGYTFSYNITNLPPRTSCAQDWYGYYNGATSNTTTVPPATVYNALNQPVIIGGADRSSNETYMKAGILEKISYPTGGYTTFDLESHKVYRTTSVVSDGTSAYAQGNTTNNLVVKSFTVNGVYQSGSGKLMINIGPYSSGSPMPFVKIKNMSTGQEQTFTSSDMTQWYNLSSPYEFASGVTYQITASCFVNQSYAMAQITSSFTNLINSPHLETFGGLRVKSIKNYKSNNELANEENYTYGENENGGGLFTGISSNSFSYGRDQRIWHISGCGYDGGGYGVFMGSPLFDQCLTQGSPVIYTDVVKYNGTPTSNAGKTTYYYGAYDVQQSITTSPLPIGQSLANNTGILIINDAWKRGHLKNSKEYKKNLDGSYVLIQEVENKYNTVATDQTFGLFAQLKFDRILLPGWEQYCGITKSFDQYAFAEYPINTGYVQLSQTIKKEYGSDGSNPLETVVNYTYDAVKNDIKIKTSFVNSKSEVIETEQKYPFHKSSLLTPITTAESIALDDMVSKNMIFPIEEIRRNNSTQISLKKTSYEYVNAAVIAPVDLKYKIKSNPIETRLKFTKYDERGNLTEQLKADDLIKSYLWGYDKSYPIAEVINAEVKDIFHTSFEEGDGNSADGDSKTGAKSKTDGFGKSLSGLTNQKYILSYWSKPGGTWIFQISTVNVTTGSYNISLSGQVDEVRLYPANAQMTTYTYKPLVGMTTQCDVNNRITYYEYDSFGRLKLVKDQDGKILKVMDYKYQQ